ncbi:MAG: IspD/TarI family cytidylyltransferase [Holophaga sp.]|nr:IspD/TarI family cytidylyltransferase [Holophaga sp.]
MTPSSFANTEDGYLVIAAGGRGLRMGGGVPKQFRDWGGRPLLEATVRAFLAPELPRLAGIVLAVPEDRLGQVNAWRFGIPCQVVAGGDTRQRSVALALAALPDRPGAFVLIHDAVRPFPPAGPVRLALAALAEWDGAVLGEASTDTLKRVDAAGRILGTEPREHIFRAQTPQVARLGLWREAFTWAEATGFQGTDDVSLLEAMGRRVKLIPAPASNLKLTTPEDWARHCPAGPQGVVD